MREFLPQEIEGSLSLERTLDAIYGTDRVTKGNGTYVEADSDRREDRFSPAEANGPGRQAEQDDVERPDRGCPGPLPRYPSGC